MKRKAISLILSLTMLLSMFVPGTVAIESDTSAGSTDVSFESVNTPETTPETTVPETTAPETTAPETTVPETTAPETTVPEITAPEITVPETTAPEITAPETTAPETTVPETTVPETTAPDTTSPETTPPETTSPETTPPETTSPETEPEQPVIDGSNVYFQFMACKSIEELINLENSLSDEMLNALTPEQRASIESYKHELMAYDKLYKDIMACTSIEQVNGLFAVYDDAQRQLFDKWAVNNGKFESYKSHIQALQEQSNANSDYLNLYNAIMACTSIEQVETLLASYSAEQLQAFDAWAASNGVLETYKAYVQNLQEQANSDTLCLNLYNDIMACTSFEQVEILLSGYSDEQLQSFENWAVTNGKYQEIDTYINFLIPQETPIPPVMPELPSELPVESEVVKIEPPAVNMTYVAPFKNPVTGIAPAIPMMFKVPSLTTFNGTEPPSVEGIETSKTAKVNSDGTITVSLEAFATGEKIITEIDKDIPTDIVLVLDQSGSMKEDFDNVQYSFTQYYNTDNNENYKNRYNGGNKNLWYKLNDGSYVAVSVEKETWEAKYEDCSNRTNGYYYNNRNNLYLLTPTGEYKKVTVTRDGNWWSTYTFTYKLEDGTQIAYSERNNTYPDFGNYGTPVRITGYDYSYTYSYTVDGQKNVIETSNGDNTVPKNIYYRREQSISGTTSRLNALKNALNSFVTSVNQKAAGTDGILGTEDDVNHRIAMVGFAYGSEGYDDDPAYTNSEIFIGSTQYRYNNRSNSAQSVYDKALQSMNTQSGRNNVSASINALSANGATYVDVGMEMANGILNANPVPAGEKRNRVVIVFTDGAPGWSGEWDGDDTGVAHNAINKAKTTKNTYGATVYSVGIFGGADATSAGNQYGNNTQKSNWFMQNLSSNNGTVQTPSYYLSASDAGGLNNIFEQISDNIEQGGSSSTLDENAVITDIISPQFKLPKGTTAENIRLETYNCTDKNGDEYSWARASNGKMGASATISDKKISVTGFDFSENYVGEIKENGTVTGYRGCKLVISFEVVPEDGFLGGNNVYTNTEANIYENSSAENPLLTFNKPQVNVPIKDITVTAENKNVYLMGSLTGAQIKEGATANAENVELKLNEPNYGLQEWQNEYVDITVEYIDSNGNTLVDFNDLKDDTIYQIKVTISPIEDGTGADGTPATAKEGSGTGNINVFKPEITWKDSQINHGETANYETQNFVKIEWKHGDILDTAVTMIGTKPTPVYEYSPPAGAFTTDTSVNVTVKINDTDVTEFVTFLHEVCDFGGCGWKAEECEFIVHIKSFDLVIKKTGAQPIDENQSFIFNVTGDNGFSLDVVIHGNGSVTIKSLPSGTYTVTEETSWSWRYTPDSKNQTVNSQSITGGQATVTFNNTRATEQSHESNLNGWKWLNGCAWCDNRWIDKKAHHDSN